MNSHEINHNLKEFIKCVIQEKFGTRYKRIIFYLDENIKYNCKWQIFSCKMLKLISHEILVMF